MTNEELERAVERLKKALKIADQYATGVHFGEGNDGFVSFADLRAILSERAELLAAVERMRGALGELIDHAEQCMGRLDYNDQCIMGDEPIKEARAALTTGEEK